MKFFKLYMGDYQRDTGSLSLAEHGAYLLMMQYAYATEAALPTGKELYRLLRAETSSEKKAVDSVVSKFWDSSAGGLTNPRITAELSAHEKTVAVNTEVGKRGGRPTKTDPVTVVDTIGGVDQITESVTDLVSENNPIRTCHSHSQTKTLSDTDVSLVAVGDGSPPASVPSLHSVTVPDCPHQDVIALYASHLPELPQPVVWDGQRANNLRARWRWVLTAKRPSGTRYATTIAEAMNFFDRYFSYVAKSDFLTGRNGKWTSCDLGWLVKAENFAKVLQGNYANQEAA